MFRELNERNDYLKCNTDDWLKFFNEKLEENKYICTYSSSSSYLL